MPARRAARIGHDRHAIAARIVGEVDIVGSADAAHDVAFGVAERDRSAALRRRAARQARWRPPTRPGGAMPGQPPSALTRSSAVTGLFGVSGGVSIEMLRMNTRPERENHCASFDNRSDAPEQPAMTGASAQQRQHARSTDSSVSHDEFGSRTPLPEPGSIRRGPSLENALTICPTITLRHDRGRTQGCGCGNRKLSLIAKYRYCRRCQRPRSSVCQ